MDQLYTLCRILERTWEFAQPVHMCFVDLEKAFNRVPRGVLWGVLREYGVSDPLIQAVHFLYDWCQSLVRIAGNKSDLFPVRVGLRQGSALCHRLNGCMLSLRDRVRSSVIQEELGVDPLLLCVERSQMRWLRHLVRMPPGRLPGEVFRARPTGRRPRGRPRTRWRDYVSRLAWERLGIPQEELDEVAGEREVWTSLLRLLPPQPDPG